jgi:hypothetical protein
MGLHRLLHDPLKVKFAAKFESTTTFWWGGSYGGSHTRRWRGWKGSNFFLRLPLDLVHLPHFQSPRAIQSRVLSPQFFVLVRCCLHLVQELLSKSFLISLISGQSFLNFIYVGKGRERFSVKERQVLDLGSRRSIERQFF